MWHVIVAQQMKNVLGINMFTIRRIADMSSSPNVALEGAPLGHSTDGVGHANSNVAEGTESQPCASAESVEEDAMPQVINSQQQAGLTAMNLPGVVELPKPALLV